MGGTTSTTTPDPTALQTALGWTSVMGGIMNPNLGQPNLTAQQTGQPTNYLSSPTNSPGYPGNQ